MSDSRGRRGAVSKTEQERADAVLSVRFTADELDRVRISAERVGMPVSVFVRRYVLARNQAMSSVTTGSSNLSSNPSAGHGLELTSPSAGFYTPAVGTNG
jgi:hypothetical protein